MLLRPDFRPADGGPPDTHGTEAAAQDRVAHLLAQAAADEETGAADIVQSLQVLRDAGWMDDCGVDDPLRTSRRLQRVGAANLPVGRLWEGHINALYLVHVHGDARAVSSLRSLVRDGAVLGVWGADGAVPVCPSDDGATLVGQKVFASGLGAVSHAIITVSSGPQVRLGLIDVRDASRADPARWQMSGMISTRSGGFACDGIPAKDVVWIGEPGVYVTEPHFVGGVWRIAALQSGAAFGLLEAAAHDLRSRDRLAAPAQMARLSSAAIAGLAAAALVDRAALQAHPAAPDAAVRAPLVSAAARLATEECALDAIRATEQSIGLPHFADGSVTGRKARDLAVYLRQAARDALQSRVGDALFQTKGGIWTVV